MALLWSFGCDYPEYSGSAPTDVAFDYVSDNSITVGNTSTPGLGPFGDGALRVGYSGDYADIELPSSYTTLFFGAWQMNASDADEFNGYIRFFNNDTELCTYQFPGAGYADPNVEFVDNDATTHTATSGIGPEFNKWKLCLMKVVFHETVGSFEVRYNGQTALSVSGVDTNGGVGGCNKIRIQTGPAVNNDSHAYDDIIVYDTSGSILNDWRGPWRIHTTTVTSDGATADFTPSSGSDHYAMVDDATFDGDSTYNESVTVGDRDVLNPNSGPTADILGVHVRVAAKAGYVGESELEVGIISGSSEQGTVSTVNPALYKDLHHVSELDPDTAAQWTQSGRNAMQIFYENNGV